jgi:hypothetical protein
MKKLIWKYLNKTYPNAYRKRTKFGLVPYGENSIIPYLNLIRDVSELFGEERRSHLIIGVINEWFDSLPVAVNLPNSTNPDVLVFEN